jgi:hypothetical protein
MLSFHATFVSCSASLGLVILMVVSIAVVSLGQRLGSDAAVTRTLFPGVLHHPLAENSVLLLMLGTFDVGSEVGSSDRGCCWCGF